MEKITVVGLAPYPVSVTGGRHIYPGEIAKVDNDSHTQLAVKTGTVGIITYPLSQDDAEKPRTRKVRERTPQEPQEITE